MTQHKSFNVLSTPTNQHPHPHPFREANTEYDVAFSQLDRSKIKMLNSSSSIVSLWDECLFNTVRSSPSLCLRMTCFVVLVRHILHLFEGFYSDSLSRSKQDCGTFALISVSPLLLNKACPIFIL